jgi:hypothetical protein
MHALLNLKLGGVKSHVFKFFVHAYLVHAEWFTVLCLEDYKEYFCTVKNLETVDGLEINEDMVERDDVVLWYHRGTAYEARILEVHGMHRITSTLQRS